MHELKSIRCTERRRLTHTHTRLHRQFCCRHRQARTHDGQHKHRQLDELQAAVDMDLLDPERQLQWHRFTDMLTRYGIFLLNLFYCICSWFIFVHYRNKITTGDKPTSSIECMTLAVATGCYFLASVAELIRQLNGPSTFQTLLMVSSSGIIAACTVLVFLRWPRQPSVNSYDNDVRKLLMS